MLACSSITRVFLFSRRQRKRERKRFWSTLSSLHYICIRLFSFANGNLHASCCCVQKSLTLKLLPFSSYYYIERLFLSLFLFPLLLPILLLLLNLKNMENFLFSFSISIDWVNKKDWARRLSSFPFETNKHFFRRLMFICIDWEMTRRVSLSLFLFLLLVLQLLIHSAINQSEPVAHKMK